MNLSQLARSLPKAELHLHIEGTLEPEMMFEMARRNGLELPYPDVESVRKAYRFTDLQSFLDIYYQGGGVLQTRDDFTELMAAYLGRAAADGVVHAEIFFDPQAHTHRGVGFEVFMPAFRDAMADARRVHGMTASLILCFLRHLPPEDAVRTITAAEDHLEGVVAVGLDSSEVGFPPEPFAEAYEIARRLGLRAVAHVGEEGPPEYIRGALDILGTERVDHGVRCVEDPGLVERLRHEQIPLTVCPLSNVALNVVDRLDDHPLPRLLDEDLMVTLNSDDPAYFGGYVGDNYASCAEAFGWGPEDLASLAANSVHASFLPAGEKEAHLGAIRKLVGGQADG
ncbi:MAG: adenosine deaminase [Actinomycetota bacterium]